MKKRKTYEISVIDKTYSKIISDETKFYTSDTALELDFKLKETEYNFESAEIVLLNVDDRSLVTRPVVKVLDSFAYELEDDIIQHYGDWRGQLRFEQLGEIYVSSPVKFRIENDLSNDRPPQLSDVQSWVSLKRYADELTEELKQAVLSVEGVEDTFNANELERQNQFETAEQSRQTLFDGNEAIRFETFNTNEATRQENETTRQQAETERATAESSRVSAEEQRKTDHANRSAELDGKADKVVLKNLVENGDFSEGTKGWRTSGYQAEFEVIDGVAKSIDFSILSRSFIQTLPEQPNVGDMIYVSLNTRIDHPDKFVNMNILKNYDGSSENKIVGPITNVTRDFMRFSGIIRHEGVFVLRVIYNFNEKGEYPAYLKDAVAINLTQTFGAGNEPTKEEMDELIKITGYIDGEYDLNSKELLVWTLSLVRNNRNAIISLGGTI